jgi:hypothetical protein
VGTPRRRSSSIQFHEAIPVPLGLYAVCVGHGTVVAGTLNDSVTSPVYPHRRGLDNGLPALGWVSRWNTTLKEDDWYCPACAKDLPPMPDEGER